MDYQLLFVILEDWEYLEGYLECFDEEPGFFIDFYEYDLDEGF